MASPCKADGCVFFGSDATNGYCSKCYKTHVQKISTTNTTTTTPQISSSTSSIDETAFFEGETIASTSGFDYYHARNPTAEGNPRGNHGGIVVAQATGDQSAKEEAISSTSTTVEIATENNIASQKDDSSSHCHLCKTKVGLYKFDCRCGGVYCREHLHFTNHSCTFDYKAYGRATIAKDNPTMVGSKLKKI